MDDYESAGYLRRGNGETQDAKTTAKIMAQSMTLDQGQPMPSDQQSAARLLRELEGITRGRWRTEPEREIAEQNWLVRAVEYLLREKIGLTP